MTSWIIQMMMMLLSVFTGSSQGKRDKVLYCSACKAIVDELNYSISQVDPKKTINVGSFRLNPDGTMKDKKARTAKKGQSRWSRDSKAILGTPRCCSRQRKRKRQKHRKEEGSP